MIYCVWYPSGGFGHFVNAILSLHGENFARPNNALTFSNTGDSHSLELAAPKYSKDQDYTFNFLPETNYSVLVDNGINNEGTTFLKTFPAAKVIKMCYTDYSWPVVASTMINKAMKSSVDEQLDFSSWDTSASWAQREKYFLFLRDHNLRSSWRADNSVSVDIETLLNYKNFKSALLSTGVSLTSFRSLWEPWLENNFKYFLPILTAQDIIKNIKNNDSVDLTTITDIWAQAVVYYYIWLEFGIEVPHNDFENFFTNTTQIHNWLACESLL